MLEISETMSKVPSNTGLYKYTGNKLLWPNMDTYTDHFTPLVLHMRSSDDTYRCVFAGICVIHQQGAHYRLCLAGFSAEWC